MQGVNRWRVGLGRTEVGRLGVACGLVVLVLVLVLVLVVPAGAQEGLVQPDDPLFLPQMRSTDDRDEPEATPPPPSPPVDPETVRAWQRALVGTPVFGYRTGRLGEVVELALNGHGQPAAAVVRLDAAIDPEQSNLPVLWRWIHGQMGAATLVVPWSAAQVAWLVRPER